MSNPNAPTPQKLPPIYPERYLEPHQARRREPTAYESLLGDAIERAFAAGLHDLPALVAQLNRTGPNAPDGQPWTEASYSALMSRLAD